jgi:hypothetical protein
MINVELFNVVAFIGVFNSFSMVSIIGGVKTIEQLP